MEGGREGKRESHSFSSAKGMERPVDAISHLLVFFFSSWADALRYCSRSVEVESSPI